MCKEDMIDILIKVTRGREEDLDAALNTLVPSNIRGTIEFLHTLLCKKKHNIEDPDRCTFYTEPNWSDDTHRHWYERTLNFIETYNLSIDDIATTVKVTSRILMVTESIKMNVFLAAINTVVNHRGGL
ncbi:MAG: hypothetical protein BWY21_00560 [Parcubacteria group bacterium ADurb.Bin216]|nr:MAG: hypothetical protein BWY21_00560 [Parcubacteria group bacterium ADurb.Bin216]